MKKIKILMYLYYPFYDKHLAGGVQVWLRQLVEKLEETNLFEISIICPDSNLHEFPKNMKINHTLVDMERDMVPLKDLYENFKKIQKMEENADIIWLIDRNFPIATSKPKVLSINTLCYEREAMSIFQSGWDKLVCTTDFVKNEIKDFIEDKSNKISIIPYFVDPIFYDDTVKPDVLSKYFKYDKNHKYILFTHRMDPGKGHITAINILKRLVEKDKSYCLLIPRPSDAKEINKKTENDYYDSIKNYVKENNLEENVIFHDWINYNDLPTYYACGEATLFLSKLPETFGLTLLNSISVGTPVISYGVGALNEVVPTGNGHFNIKNEEEAFKIIYLGKNTYDVASDRTYVINKYNMEKVVEDYIEVFKNM